MESIKELRAALGLNQIEFATRLGKSYASIQRYEGIRPPVGEGLVPFVGLARECQRLDLAKTFKAAIIQDISPELVKLIRETGPEDEYTEKKADEPRALHKGKVRG